MSRYLNDLPKDIHAALGHCYFPPDTSELVAELYNWTLFVASNDFVLNNSSTYAWLYGAQSETCVYGHDPAPGGG